MSVWGAVGGLETCEEGVETGFESSLLMYTAEVGGDGGDGGDLLRWQRRVVSGVDAAHLVVAGGVGEKGEEGVGRFGWGEAGPKQEPEPAFHDL